MTKLLVRAGLLWCASALLAEAGTIVQSMDDVQYWVGTGENRAVLIIDWQDNKSVPGETGGQALAWGYRWPTGQSPKGRDMLEAIAAADPRLELRLDFRSFGMIVFGLGYDLDGDGGTFNFDPINEEGSASDANDHFAEGWREAFWGYRVNNPTKPGSTLLPEMIESGAGFESRVLTNNSWDAWVLSRDIFDYSIPELSPALAATVPEASTAALLGCGILLFGLRRSRV